MILTTTDTISGKEIETVFGTVKGNTIRARHVGHDIIAGLRTIVGGEIDEYTKLMGEAREQAIDRMKADACRMGANAVVGLRLTTSMIAKGAAEILAYGTAVKLKDEGLGSDGLE